MKPLSAPRLLSLDAYRGFVMLVLVSGGGLGLERLRASTRFGFIATQLEHRTWQGCSLWDLVQPAFMFIVGVAMPFAARQNGRTVRALKLCLLGILLDGWRRGHVELELVSVLQQIALAYLFASLLVGRGPRLQALAATALLGAHTAAFALYGRANGVDAWSPAGNVGLTIDRLVRLPTDPEGYSTFNVVSSTATVIFGVLAGELLRGRSPARLKCWILMASGLLGVGLGFALATAVPLVKHVWTASFGLFASGWVCLLFAAFYAVIDVRRTAQTLAFPLVVVGKNSIGVYVFSGLLASPLRALFRPVMGAAFSTLVVIGLTWSFAYALYRRGIFLRV